MQAAWGFSPVLGSPVAVATWMGGPDCDAFQVVVARVAESGEAAKCDVRMAQPERNRASWAFSLSTGGGGLVLALGRDVSDEVRRIRAIHERNRQLRLAAKVAGLGFWRLDITSRLGTWSPELLKLLGLDSATEILPLDVVLGAVHPEDRPSLRFSFDQAARAGRAFDLELRVNVRDGELRTVVFKGRVERESEPELTAVFGVAYDITDAKVAREVSRKVQVQSLIGELAEGVAHTMSNAMTVVSGNLDLLREELVSATQGLPATAIPSLVELLDDSRYGASRVNRVIGGLKTFSTLKQESVEEVAVNEAVETALDLAQSEIRQRVVVERVLNVVPPALANRAAFLQLLVNVLVSALRASRLSGGPMRTVRVSTSFVPSRNLIQLEVSDGSELRGELRSQRALERATMQGHDGVPGLGVAHAAIKRIGGSLEVASGEEQGTIITVHVPAGGDAAAKALSASAGAALGLRDARPAVSPPRPFVASRGKPRVLIVSLERAQELARAIEADYEVQVSASGEAALALASERDFDAFICDDAAEYTAVELVDELSLLYPGSIRRCVLMISDQESHLPGMDSAAARMDWSQADERRVAALRLALAGIVEGS
jgi:PAS domain S-box-containing protein